ncbi:iron-containing alcohol dehydrogenase [Lutibaculum baratangense]|uniref:Alcohol dehydrogenase n=1 Tax=Lutibaculum baratangense AMV1 TaxID=631454 RepID=V4RU50_9HYPH|nr:iron-containing alcohol dehydrogenase [Lutibaculum baratangense]ESR26620.1 Alcohol dehydrogenase [Lutibaculum baratangense AMV1]
MSIIQYLTTIRFEFGATAAIADDVRELKLRRPLVVTDAGVAAAGIAAQVAAATGLRDLPTFTGTPANPTEEAVELALATYREERCDGLVAIGGGSPIDLAKAVALLAAHPAPLSQYAANAGGVGRIGPDMPPLIAVPTTAGTGSEVGRAALITLREGRKLGFISPYLIPKRAICDPELTLGLPRGLTAATGMDAVTHCLETYLSPRINPPAEAIALDGLRRAIGHIERACSDGSNREARHEMMMAALEGGLTFQKGLGAVHALSHPLGGLKEPSLHHGTLNAVLLPPVLRMNEPAAKTKYAAIRRTLDLAPDADLADFVTQLNARLGLPADLRSMGVDEAILATIPDAAMQDHSHATNARPLGREQYEIILKEALGAPSHA